MMRMNVDKIQKRVYCLIMLAEMGFDCDTIIPNFVKI